MTVSSDEPFIPPPCMTPVPLTNGHDTAARDEADVIDEEVVVSTTDIHMDDELAAEKTAEKMIERRIQVWHELSVGVSQ